MPHVEIPLPTGHHITVVHIGRKLQRPDVENLLRGLDKLGQRGSEIQFYWGAPEFVGYRKNIPAILVEDANGVFTELREELVRGLDYFGIPVSKSYGKYMPHVTNAPPQHAPWSLIEFLPQFNFVQKPDKVAVTFS